MKAVVLYETGSANMDQIMAVYPRHKALIDEFAARGDLLAVGAFANRDGSMGVFKNREAAEAFVARDPFMLEGFVGKCTIKDWNEILMG